MRSGCRTSLDNSPSRMDLTSTVSLTHLKGAALSVGGEGSMEYPFDTKPGTKGYRKARYTTPHPDCWKVTALPQTQQKAPLNATGSSQSVMGAEDPTLVIRIAESITHRVTRELKYSL